MSDSTTILQFIEAMKLRLNQRATTLDEVGKEAARVLALLDTLPALTGTFPKSEHPSARHLDAALAASGNPPDTLLTSIRTIAFHLPWRYSYARRSDAPGLEDNMAFAEVIGPDAPYVSERACLGLTLIGPNMFYPPHRHPAIELYYVVAGEATWIADGVLRRNPPGTFILHHSQAVHAMQTYQEPLLAVYTWSGEDIRSPSVYG